MNLYGTTKECPKCGNKKFQDKYEECAVGVVNKEVITGMAGDEVIARECTNCGFVFLENPLDKVKFGGEFELKGEGV